MGSVESNQRFGLVILTERSPGNAETPATLIRS